MNTIKKIIMNYRGNYNGYVGIWIDHPLFKKPYQTYIHCPETSDLTMDARGLTPPVVPIMCIDFEKTKLGYYPLDVCIPVHGGITYSSETNPETKEKDGFWYFGFDTAHSGDDRPEVQNMEYIQKQVDNLAEWIEKHKDILFFQESESGSSS